MFGFDRITFDPNIMGGRACIRGMRITVAFILNLVANGMTTEVFLVLPMIALVVIACAPTTAVPAVTPLPTPPLTPLPPTATLVPPTPTFTLIPPMPTPITSQPIPTSSIPTEVRDVVEGFGKKLQWVWLQSPKAEEQMREQYSQYVSPELLEEWANALRQKRGAPPGRAFSSPWPDGIEITSITKEAPDRYLVAGNIIEVTSQEAVSGGAANKIPVRIVVQKVQGHWVITEYEQAG
jgi:hypothetical protein